MPQPGHARLRRRCKGLVVVGAAVACLSWAGLPAQAQGQGRGQAAKAATAQALQRAGADGVIVEAQEAWRKKDRERLASARAAAAAQQHPLTQWVEYLELNNRLTDAQQSEVTAFFARWPGTYVEDRLRNDWLLELGKRRDFVNFAAEFPRFRMNDDREVTCYALMLDHQSGKAVREDALATWLLQRDADDGCDLMANTLLQARSFTLADVWLKLRTAVDAGRMRAARQAAQLLDPGQAERVNQLLENPMRFLALKASTGSRGDSEVTALALLKLAGSDPAAAAQQLNDKWDRAMPADVASGVWALVAKQAAIRLLPEAPDHFQRGALRATKSSTPVVLADDTLAWKVRAALRADGGRARWQQVMQGVNAMSAEEQRDPAWVYWKARALLALAQDSQDGESMRGLAQSLLQRIAGEYHFYGKLAADQLGQALALPAAPAPLTAAERDAAANHPGFVRALQLIGLDLRSEGVREWNYSRRGMNERELLAAAQLACDREVWDRCISTSDRTEAEIDMAQRFPMPFRKEVVAKATEIGLDPAFVYGLIRQESRFVMNARSTVGASGLMQLMPGTARWTARKIGLDYSHELISDRDTNLKLGTTYLKLMLDEFANSPAMAAAAYNAGPGRPRKWREGPVLEPAVWAENIPFSETRDYVKKVLSNTAYYAALLSATPGPLKMSLGKPVSPREPDAPPPDKDMP